MSKPKTNLTITSISIQENYIQVFDKLIELGVIPSRSEAVRRCVDYGLREWIKQEDSLTNFLESSIKIENIIKLINETRGRPKKEKSIRNIHWDDFFKSNGDIISFPKKIVEEHAVILSKTPIEQRGINEQVEAKQK